MSAVKRFLRTKRTEDRESKRSVFRPYPARSAASLPVFCPLKSLSSELH
ncbi:MAG: hypothetical protein LBD06_07665 [Candidatus Accumulibacter sp.]|nr:hypothetical protein [Accumulibacter sp.]